MGRTSLASLVFALAVGGLVVVGPGCSSSSESDPESAPASSPPPAGTAPPESTTPPAPAPPSGPPVTTVRVHYSSTRAGDVWLRGSAVPLTWEKGIAVTATKPGLFTWSSPDVKVDLELKPMLGETWSRGPNYKVKPGQAIDIYPHFFESKGTVTKRASVFSTYVGGT
jgi:hypothetical protein